MLINPITNYQYNNIPKYLYNKNKKDESSSPINNSGVAKSPCYACFCNLNFKSNPDCTYLMRYAGKLKCAYSGREMLTPTQLAKAYQAIEKQKKPNVLSGINVLKSYQKYMHTIESQIFDIFQDAQNKTKQNFQNVLSGLVPESLERLKQKQTQILNSTNSLIESLPDKTFAEEIIKIRDFYLKNIQNGEFSRKGPLDSIDNLMKKRNIANLEIQNCKTSDIVLRELNEKYKEYETLYTVYKSWYLLPSPTVDFDAFVVKYSKREHTQIAKALLAPSVATIEHIEPSGRNGADTLSNYLLVCSDYNRHRGTLSLDKFIELRKALDIPDTKDIETHLQNYINQVIFLTKKGEFKDHLSYPTDIAKTILDETQSRVNLDTKDFYCLAKTMQKERQIYQQSSTSGNYKSKNFHKGTSKN